MRLHRHGASGDAAGRRAMRICLVQRLGGNIRGFVPGESGSVETEAFDAHMAYGVRERRAGRGDADAFVSKHRQAVGCGRRIVLASVDAESRLGRDV